MDERVLWGSRSTRSTQETLPQRLYLNPYSSWPLIMDIFLFLPLSQPISFDGLKLRRDCYGDGWVVPWSLFSKGQFPQNVTPLVDIIIKQPHSHGTFFPLESTVVKKDRNWLLVGFSSLEPKFRVFLWLPKRPPSVDWCTERRTFFQKRTSPYTRRIETYTVF